MMPKWVEQEEAETTGPVLSPCRPGMRLAGSRLREQMDGKGQEMRLSCSQGDKITLRQRSKTEGDDHPAKYEA